MREEDRINKVMRNHIIEMVLLKSQKNILEFKKHTIKKIIGQTQKMVTLGETVSELAEVIIN